ncbi:MAG: hypothetical protein IKI03_08810 [Clostridia bacterium]|nr:hypothetical protein [Clostridia bacterium]
MKTKYEIEIPSRFAERLLRLASETELPLTVIVEAVLKNYMERSKNNA